MSYAPNMSYAPIALFVYNRPIHTKRTIESLKANSLSQKSEIFIFCDGAQNPLQQESVSQVRSYVKSINGFKKIKIIERDKNLGLAASIISGVSEIVEKYGKIIVLEDDMVVSPYFLDFMNNALEKYQDQDQVVSIHGYIYPTKKPLPNTFFLKGADCWGWATWKRGWNLFEKNGSKLLEELRNRKLTKKFDFDGTYHYTKMLEDQIAGKNNSWAIRWYASAFLANKLTLYPGESLLKNIGTDGSGTHCADMDSFNSEVNNEKVVLEDIEIIENQKARHEIKKFFKPKRGLFRKISHKINKKIKKKKAKKEKYGWFSTELNWQEAKETTSGYDDGKILEKCKNSLLKVKNDEAEYERNSVIFDKIEYSWPTLSTILFAAAKNSGKLDLIDFGGSLGSTYFQNRKFLSELESVNWNIVEQKKFVDCGKKYFADNRLKFYHKIEDCLKENKPNILLLSSAIQYLEKPYEFLDEILNKNFEFLTFDLTGFHNEDRDILTIQKVWPEVYKASYPCWFFSKTKFFTKILEKYQLIEEFESHFGSQISIDEKPQAKYLGAIFKLKNNA